MEGSEGWERIPDFFAAAGDIQAKPTRVSGGLDLIVQCTIIHTYIRKTTTLECICFGLKSNVTSIFYDPCLLKYDLLSPARR